MDVLWCLLSAALFTCTAWATERCLIWFWLLAGALLPLYITIPLLAYSLYAWPIGPKGSHPVPWNDWMMYKTEGQMETPFASTGLVVCRGKVNEEDFIKHLEERLVRYKSDLLCKVLVQRREALFFQPLASFDVRKNVFFHSLPTGSKHELEEEFRRIVATDFDPQKPLFEFYIYSNVRLDLCGFQESREGVSDVGWAMMMRVHHVLVDGVATANIAMMLLDDSPYGDNVVGKDTTEIHKISAKRVTPNPIGFNAMRVWSALRQIFYLNDSPNCFQGHKQGELQHCSWIMLGHLDELKEISRKHRGTITSLTLSCITTVLARFFRDNTPSHTVPSHFSCCLSVNLRTELSADVMPTGNRVAIVIARLPLAQADDHLYVIRNVSGQLQNISRTLEMYGNELTSWISAMFPEFVRKPTCILFCKKFSTMFTSIPGPQTTKYMLGSQVIAVVGFNPLFLSGGVSFVIVSYDGKVFLCMCAYDSVMDKPQLDHCVEAIKARVNCYK